MEKDILKKLDGVPSCFHTFYFVQTIAKEKKEKILGRVISEINTDGYVSALEGSRALNFISYMSFSVGKFEDAVRYNNMALKNSETNINALVCKARYHLHKSEFADSLKQVDLLDELKNDHVQMIYAKADQAYACSRLGMIMYKKAEKLFEEALTESADIQACVPQYEICLMKFGLALTISRQQNISNAHTETIDNFGEEAQGRNRLLELFMDIIKMQSENIKKHKARVYIQIGETVDLLATKSQTQVIPKHILAYFPGKDIPSKVRGCYEKGFSLQNDDVFVIERFAKYCRVKGRVGQSVELCKRALSIRETSTGHHYLALALKTELHFAINEQNNCKRTQQKYHKPSFVPDLHMKKKNFPTNQDQHVTKIIHYSDISSMEPQENSKLSYSAGDHAVEQTFSATNEGKATCRERRSVKKNINDVLQSHIDYVTEYFQKSNLVSSELCSFDHAISPKTDDFSGCRNSYREDGYQYIPVEATRVSRKQHRKRDKRNATRAEHFYDTQEMGNKSFSSNNRKQGYRTKNATRAEHFYDRQDMGNKSYSLNDREQGYTTNKWWNNSNEETRNCTRNTEGQQQAELSTQSCVISKTLPRHEEQPLYALSQLITSPKKLFPLPRDQICDIIFHLDRAMDLAENTAAMYEKALVLRAAGLHKEALRIFKSMFRNKSCSVIQSANAYEQSALCLQDQIESDIKTDCSEVEKMMIDLKEYLLKSIEITWYLIAKQPTLKSHCISFSTLNCLLEEHQKSNIKEFEILHRRFRDNKWATGWFKNILKMETDDSNKAQVHMDIVRDCLKAKKYAEAILHLDMVQCLRDCEHIIDEHLYFEAHIEGGLKSFMKGEEDIAGLRLKNALDYKRCDENQEQMQNQVGRQEQDRLVQQEWFDVFILSDPTTETTRQNICCLLRQLGLKATLNDDCAAPELPSIYDLTKDIERSTHGIVILGNDMDNIRHMQMFTDIAKKVQENHKYGNIVVVMDNENVQVDLMLTGFTSIIYEKGLTGSITEDHKHWLKKLLWILASGNKMLE